MQNVNKSDVSSLLEKWHETKLEIGILEARCEKYKKYAARIMDTKHVSVLSNDYYKLQRREMSRDTMGKKDVPKEIWNKYSKRSTYSAYYLTEKK